MICLDIPETKNELEFYENCQIGDTSYWRRDIEDQQKQACGVRVTALFYCTRSHGHGGTRCVAEDETLVIAVLNINCAN